MAVARAQPGELSPAGRAAVDLGGHWCPFCDRAVLVPAGLRDHARAPGGKARLREIWGICQVWLPPNDDDILWVHAACACTVNEPGDSIWERIRAAQAAFALGAHVCPFCLGSVLPANGGWNVGVVGVNTGGWHRECAELPPAGRWHAHVKSLSQRAFDWGFGDRTPTMRAENLDDAVKSLKGMQSRARRSR